jgi:hypothetical protein
MHQSHENLTYDCLAYSEAFGEMHFRQRVARLKLTVKNGAP